jgi:hypothetical protein
MTKLAYTNDQQIINDAAQMLIENHLHWSGSNEGMPSNDLGNVSGVMLDAYRRANIAVEEWKSMDEEMKRDFLAKVELLYTKAAQLADRKWEAAMTLLGF